MCPLARLTCLLSLLLPATVWSASELTFALDPEGSVGTLEVPLAVPFEVYAVGTNMEDFFAVEFGGEGSLLDEAAVVVLSTDVLGSVYCGLQPCCTGFSCVFGTGGCVASEGGAPTALVRWTLIALAPVPADLTLCVTGYDPSSFPDGTPGYANCDEELIVFGAASNPCGAGIPDGCLVLNPSFDCDAVGDAADSFGAMKSLYRE